MHIRIKDLHSGCMILIIHRGIKIRTSYWTSICEFLLVCCSGGSMFMERYMSTCSIGTRQKRSTVVWFRFRPGEGGCRGSKIERVPEPVPIAQLELNLSCLFPFMC